MYSTLLDKAALKVKNPTFNYLIFFMGPNEGGNMRKVAPFVALSAVAVAGCVSPRHPVIPPAPHAAASVNSETVDAYFKQLPDVMRRLKGVVAAFPPEKIKLMNGTLDGDIAEANRTKTDWGKEEDSVRKVEALAVYEVLVAIIGSERAALAYIASVTSVR